MSNKGVHWARFNPETLDEKGRELWVKYVKHGSNGAMEGFKARKELEVYLTKRFKEKGMIPEREGFIASICINNALAPLIAWRYTPRKPDAKDLSFLFKE